MLKKSIYVAGGGLVIMTLLFGRDAYSYLATSVGWVKDSVKQQVPVEFQIERARQMISKLGPEVRNNMRLIAKEEVEVENLTKRVDRLEDKLVSDKEKMLKMKADLDTGSRVLVYCGTDYTPTQVRMDLENRFQRFQTNEETLVSLKKVLSAREASLKAARQKLDGMLAARRQLQVDVANLEARQTMIEVAQTTSDVNLDDSVLARTRELVGSIETRLEVAERLAAADIEYYGEIPVDEEAENGDISARIAEYFDEKPEIEVLVGNQL